MRRAVAVAAVLSLAGCATPPGETPVGELGGSLTVYAAASLSDAFNAIAAQFEAAHPRIDVTVSYSGSAALAQQIVHGAPADVFAAASEDAMKVVIDAGLSSTAPIFARNTLELAVPAGNAAGVTGLADLARPELVVALCSPEVPCGVVAEQLLADADVIASVDTLEQDVRAVLTKVELGEVDAGLVYRTDVLTAGATVEGIAIPNAMKFETRYPIASLTTATNHAAAVAFVAWVLGERGRETLDDAGFGTP